MSTYIDIHALTSLGPNNLNRDVNGMPKTIVFGGITRHRLSSQSQKYATRGDFIRRYQDEMTALRSRSVPSLVVYHIQKLDPSITLQDARKLVGLAFTLLGKKDRPAAHKKVLEEFAKDPSNYVPAIKATFQISTDQAEEFAKVMLDEMRSGTDFTNQDITSDTRVIARLVSAVKDHNSADVLLFGRMMADNTALNVDATCQVAHAVGVSEYAGDIDMFIAADELLTRKDSPLAESVRELGGVANGGADMLDSRGISAGTVYRYANVNASALIEATGSVGDAATIVERFIQSFATTLPSGAQNSHAARSPFSTLVITVRSTAPMSLVSAFEVPVKNAGEATSALTAYATSIADMYGEPVGDQVYVLTLHNRSDVVSALGADEDVTTLGALTDAVGDVVRGL